MQYLIALVVNLAILFQANYFEYNVTTLLVVFLLEVPIIMLMSIIKAVKIDGFSGGAIAFASALLGSVFLLLGFLAVAMMECLVPGQYADFSKARSTLELISDVQYLYLLIVVFVLFHGLGVWKFIQKKNYEYFRVHDVVMFNSVRAGIVVFTASIMGSVFANISNPDPKIVIYVFVGFKILTDLLQVIVEEKRCKKRKGELSKH